MYSPPVVLSIAGSDCSSGAGIQADLKTFSYFGTHGLTAVSCVVAETPHQVLSIHPVPPTILQDQIKILLDTYDIKAIKTGMLYSKPHIVAITELLQQRSIPLIVDPVMVATSGTPLLKKEAIDAYLNRLLPFATLITPNLAEASTLLQQEIVQLHQMEQAAAEIAQRFDISCLLKGGHLPSSEERTDILWHQDQSYHYTAPTISIESTHGTGCTLSAAITALLAHDLKLPEAIQHAKDWTHRAIGESFCLNAQEKLYALNQLRPESLNTKGTHH